MSFNNKTKDDIIKELNNCKPEKWYDLDCIKNSHKNDLYFNVVLEYLSNVNIIELFENIIPISRHDYNKKYFVESHKPLTSDEKEIISEKRRYEEWFARYLMNGKHYDYFGEIIDYQTPIKGKRTHDAGKVDMLAYNKKGFITLIELKREDNSEAILRTILEIFSYYYMIDKKQLEKELQENPKYKISKNCQKGILIFENSQLHTQYNNSILIQKLSNNLEVKIYTIKKNGEDFNIFDNTIVL